MRCVVSGEIPSAKFKKSHSPKKKKKKKKIRSYRISKNKLESSRGGYNLSLGDSSPGKWEFGVWLMPLLILVITVLMLLMIVPCITNYLTHFVSFQVNMQVNSMQSQFNKDI